VSTVNNQITVNSFHSQQTGHYKDLVRAHLQRIRGSFAFEPSSSDNKRHELIEEDLFTRFIERFNCKKESNSTSERFGLWPPFSFTT